MVDFSISSDIQAIIDPIRAFVRDELVPLEADGLTTPFRQLIPTLKESVPR